MFDTVLEQDNEILIADTAPKKKASATPQRSMEELDERYINFCEKHDLDLSTRPEDLLYQVEFESAQYRYIDRYLKQRQAAFNAGLFTLDDAPRQPTTGEQRSAAKSVMEELEALAEMDAETLIESMADAETDVSENTTFSVGSVIATVIPQEKPVTPTPLPCLTAKRTKSGAFQMGFAL